jgi:hypothetical protein
VGDGLILLEQTNLFLHLLEQVFSFPHKSIVFIGLFLAVKLKLCQLNFPLVSVSSQLANVLLLVLVDRSQRLYFNLQLLDIATETLNAFAG